MTSKEPDFKAVFTPKPVAATSDHPDTVCCRMRGCDKWTFGILCDTCAELVRNAAGDGPIVIRGELHIPDTIKGEVHIPSDAEIDAAMGFDKPCPNCSLTVDDCLCREFRGILRAVPPPPRDKLPSIVEVREEIAPLEALLICLNEDERAVTLGVAIQAAERMRSGRTRYKPLDLATDTRDFMAEAQEENIDAALYVEKEKRRRSIRG